MINKKSIKKTGNKWKKRFLVLFSLIILVFVSMNLAKTWQRNKQVNQEITSLKKEISDLEQGNSKMRELIEYFNSNAYIEEKARLDLGLKKEGEKVVIVNNNIDNGIQNSNTPQNEDETKNGKEELSNPQKWLRYFFN